MSTATKRPPVPSIKRKSPPQTDTIVGAADQLGCTACFVRKCVKEGKLLTITPPGTTRARLLQSSIDAMYQEIYKDVQQAG